MFPPLKSGEVLRGRYKIQERIGQGGMGSIYLADDIRLKGRQCALKEVEYDRALPENIRQEARDQFLREATVLARLDHPNLPKVSDFFSSGPRDYLVMDYVPGKDLRALLLEARRNKTFLLEKDVLSWAEQLSNALAFLHSQEPPIVHRDIKPSNLKLMPHGLIKLVDFGLVKILAPEEVTITIIQGQGTALYTPLEQYGGSDIHTDIRSDIYSFGATLYHLLTNEAPADARKRFLQPESLVPIRQINPDISARTEKAILWAMSLHPDERPDTVEDFRQALLGYRETPNHPLPIRHNREVPIADYFTHPPEATLAWSAAVLLLISLLATLVR
ncbi:MAG: serine/threonine protein kinase [Syntrophothermus sp.]